MDSLTEFEMAAIRFLLAGDHAVLRALRAQAQLCRVRTRDFSGTGVFTYLSVPENVERAPTKSSDLRLRDVHADVAGLKHGAGLILYVTDGFLELLECFSYEEEWPDQIRAYSFRYETDPERDLAALGLD